MSEFCPSYLYGGATGGIHIAGPSPKLLQLLGLLFLQSSSKAHKSDFNTWRG